MKRLPAEIAAVCAFISLIIFPEGAASGVRTGLYICTHKILPSLLPFFIMSSLLTNLGLTQRFGRVLAPISSKLFRVSGAGGSAFIIGLTGGYPLGAEYISELYKKRIIEREEAEKLLVFCNNSGPAFIIGACGVGVFNSSAAGVFLYAVHIFAALLGGILFSGKSKTAASYEAAINDLSFANAFTSSVKSSVNALINVCGFILAFSVLIGMFDFYTLAGSISQYTGLELSYCRGLITGIFEIGSGMGSMAGLYVSPINLALAAFLLGWGGISVHFQTFSAVSDTDIKTARYVIGRLIIALFGALTAFLGAYIFF